MTNLEWLNMKAEREPVNASYLFDWYITSVGDDEPIWTEAHITELLNDFVVIPRNAR